MNKKIYVMSEPRVKVENEKFEFVGEAKPVDGEFVRIIDYLDAVDAYNSQLERVWIQKGVRVWNGSVNFDNNFLIGDASEEADKIMTLLDEPRLQVDLDKKGYAVLMAKGDVGNHKYQNKGNIVNLNRVIQDMVFQRLAKDINQDVRHLKTQESFEMMDKSKEYQEKMKEFWAPALEIILKESASHYALRNGASVTPQILTPHSTSSFNTRWHAYGWYDDERDGLVVDHYFRADACSPLYGDEKCIAVLKVSPEKK